MSTVTRKRYTPEFKAQAVELVAIGKPVPEVAEEFGIGTSILYRWVGKEARPDQPGEECHGLAKRMPRPNWPVCGVRTPTSSWRTTFYL